MFEQQGFASMMEFRLRKKWPKATVEYSGGGWFTFCINEFPSVPYSMRRDQLKAKVATIEYELKEKAE